MPKLEQPVLVPRQQPASTLPSPTFRNNFAWTLGANLVYAACQWAMLVAIAKRCRVEELGLFTLGLAITAPVFMLANLQLRAVQVTDARNRYRFRDYCALRILASILGLAVVAVLAWFPERSRETAIVVALLGISKSLESMSDILQGYMQRHERMAKVARSLLLKGVLSLGLVFLAVLRWPTGIAAAAAIAAGSCITLLLYDWPVVKRMHPFADDDFRALSVKNLRSLSLLALPLGIVQGLVSLSSNIPRYYLERFAGPGDLGIFAALASVIVVGQTAISALGQVASPRLADYFAQGNIDAFRSLFVKIAGAGALIGIAMVAAAALFGRPLLTLLFRKEYAAHSDLLVLIMVAGTVAYVAWLAGFGLTAAQAFRVQIPLLGGVCLAAWAGAILWIPAYGSRGAAFALLFSMAVQLAGAVFMLTRLCRSQSLIQTNTHALEHA